MYVLVSPCILHPDLRAKGITNEKDLEWFARALQRCQQFDIETVPLPCPETLYLGNEREPGMFLDRLYTKEFVALLDTLEEKVREIISKRGPPLFIVGVNSSPACGVNTTWYGPHGSPDARKWERGAFLSRFPNIPAIDVSDFSRYRVYLAAPLFSLAERRYNIQLADLLHRNYYEVYLPQDSGDDSHKRERDAHMAIFRKNLAALDRSDVVVAVIDGPDVDSGTAWEMGYAFSKGIPVVSLRTDFRKAGYHEDVNLMLEHSSTVVHSEEGLVAALLFPGGFQAAHKC